MARLMTTAQFDTLERLAWTPDDDGVWWHDLPYPTRDVLLARGWLQEAYNPGCQTKGHKHPGYVTISDAGYKALVEARATFAGYVRGSFRDRPITGRTLCATQRRC